MIDEKGVTLGSLTHRIAVFRAAQVWALGEGHTDMAVQFAARVDELVARRQRLAGAVAEAMARSAERQRWMTFGQDPT